MSIMKLIRLARLSMKQHEQAEIFLRKAQQDEDLLDVIFTSTKVSDEIFGFHCQQAVEKLLKALLSYLGTTFKRTHNIRTLMDALADAKHPLPTQLSKIDALTPFGTVIRYEDPNPDLKINRKSMRKKVMDLRKWVEKEIERNS